MVSTLDFESSDPSSNLGGTSDAFLLLYLIFYLKSWRYVHALLKNNTQNVKVTRPSYFVGVPSYFEALWYPPPLL